MGVRNLRYTKDEARVALANILRHAQEGVNLGPLNGWAGRGSSEVFKRFPTWAQEAYQSCNLPRAIVTMDVDAILVYADRCGIDLLHSLAVRMHWHEQDKGIDLSEYVVTPPRALASLDE